MNHNHNFMKTFILIASAILFCSTVFGQNPTYYAIKDIPEVSSGTDFSKWFEIIPKEKIVRRGYYRGYENMGILSTKAVGKKQTFTLTYMTEGGDCGEEPTAIFELEDTADGKIARMIDYADKKETFAAYVGTKEERDAAQKQASEAKAAKTQPAAKPTSAPATAEPTAAPAAAPAEQPQSKPAEKNTAEEGVKQIKDGFNKIFKKK